MALLALYPRIINFPLLLLALAMCLGFPGEANADPGQRNLEAQSVAIGSDIIPVEESVERSGNRIRQRLMHWDFKYPMVQVRETIAQGPAANANTTLRDAKVADHLMVSAANGVSELDVRALATRLGMQVRRRLRNSQVYLLSFRVRGFESIAEAKQSLLAEPKISSVDEDTIIQVKATPNDPGMPNLWGMLNNGQSGGTAGVDIDATLAWNSTTGSRNIVVGVIDTGIDYTHADLADNMWTNPGESGLDSFNNDKRFNGIDDDNNGYIDDWRGWDFANNDNNPMDDHYHGTHCAGTIGAVGNNNIGVAGVCWQVSMVAMKFLDSTGNGTSSDSVEAVLYAANLPIHLTSNSWGGGSYNQALKDAIDLAGSRNQLFVAAAGNDPGNNNDQFPTYPGSYTSPNIIAVAATDRNDLLATFSCYGATSVDLAAPGVDIYSCKPGNLYQLLSGTSMATPHVAGACALLKSYNPFLSTSQIKNALLNNGDVIPAMTGKCVSNSRLNLHKALTSVAGPLVTKGSLVMVEDGNGDGIFNPGEAVNITLELIGGGSETVQQVAGIISTSDPTASIEQGVVSYGSLTPGQSSTGGGIYKIRLLAGTTTPHMVNAQISVNSNANSFNIPLVLPCLTTSSISGQVKRVNGTAVGSANVIWTGTSSGQTMANANGQYSILLGDGTYQLVAKSSGFADSFPVNATVPPNANLDLVLRKPILSLTPASLSIRLQPGEIASKTLTLNNPGDANMEWNAMPVYRSIVASGFWHETTYRSPDAQKNWYYGQESTRNYNNGAANSGALILKSINLPLGPRQFSFRQWRQTETGSIWDKSLVQLSLDNGNTWTTLLQVLNTSATWINGSVNLSSYAGNVVDLRFYFDTVDHLSNSLEGWYVGDFKINNQHPLQLSSLTATPAKGVISSGAQANIIVSASAINLATGIYQDSISFESNDPVNPVAQIPVTINVKTNSIPVVNSGSSTTPYVTPIQVPLIGSDGDGDPLDYFLLSTPLHGSAIITGNILTYTPALDWHGIETLFIRATDGYAESSTATWSITVMPPVAIVDMAVNFQVSATLPVPGFPGYWVDAGQIFGTRTMPGSNATWNFGWNTNHVDVTRNRNLNSDERLDTLCHFHFGGVWEIALPNGSYDVTITIGDASAAGTHTINAESTNFWNTKSLLKNVFETQTKTILVTDGRLSINQGNAANMKTRINYILIHQNLPVNHPPVAAMNVTPLGGPAPLLVSCTSLSTDEDGDALTTSWDFGDQQSSSLANTTHTYSSAGDFLCRLTVTDTLGLSSTTTTTVTVTPQLFQLSVSNGSGDGNYPAGTVVSINADPAPLGQVFDQWTGAGIANIHAPATTLIMPASHLSVAATYKSLPPSPAAVAESFSYSGTHIVGQNGGNGWAGPWTITTPKNSPYNNNTLDSIAFINIPGFASSGQHLKWWTATGTNPQTITRSFATPITDDGNTHWLAFAIQSGSQKYRTGLWLNGYAGSSLLSLYGGSSASTPSYYLLDDTSTGASPNRIASSSNTTYLMVFKIQMSGTAGANDSVTVYANPSLSSDASTWTAAVPTRIIDLGAGFTGISLRSNNNGNVLSFARLDEMRLGTTWQSAVGISNP